MLSVGTLLPSACVLFLVLALVAVNVFMASEVLVKNNIEEACVLSPAHSAESSGLRFITFICHVVGCASTRTSVSSSLGVEAIARLATPERI